MCWHEGRLEYLTLRTSPAQCLRWIVCLRSERTSNSFLHKIILCPMLICCTIAPCWSALHPLKAQTNCREAVIENGCMKVYLATETLAHFCFSCYTNFYVTVYVKEFLGKSNAFWEQMTKWKNRQSSFIRIIVEHAWNKKNWIQSGMTFEQSNNVNFVDIPKK